MAKLNRLIAAILVSAMLISAFPAAVWAVEETEYTEVTLSLNSNTTLDTSVTGLYKDNVFYVSLPVLCDLVNADIEYETHDHAIIRTNYGYRRFSLYFEESQVEEYLTSDCSYIVSLPQARNNGMNYVSLIHFLEYLGIDYQIGNEGSHNLIIYKRYNIFDAIGEYFRSNSGNHFEWEEVDITHDTASDCAVLSLISSDPNILKMIINPDGMLQDGMEDALLAVVRNEGYYDDVNEDNDDNLQSSFQGLSLTKDLLGIIQASYKADNLPDSGALEQLSKKVDLVGIGSEFLMAGVAAFESAAKFDYMTKSQKSLLSDTVIKHSGRAKVLEGAWNVVIDAAKEIQFRVDDTYQNNLIAAQESTMDLIYSLTQGVITNADPYTTAINAVFNGFFFITKSLLPDGYQYANCVSQAYNCYVLQFASDEIFSSLYAELCDNNFCFKDTVTQRTYWDQIKQALIFKIKSTITLRDYLFAGDCIESQFRLDQTFKNQTNISLLSKLEGCEIMCFTDREPNYDHDLSWMKELPLRALVTDAYANDCTYTVAKYDYETKKSEDTLVTSTYRIPQINLTGKKINQINEEIYNSLYPVAQAAAQEITEYGYPFTSEEISYQWAVNDNILSLVILNCSSPDSGGGNEYMVYNISIPYQEQVYDSYVIDYAGFMEPEFRERAKQVLGSRFWSNWNKTDSAFESSSFVEFFNKQLGKSISDNNISQALPYLNSDGQLCIVAKLYSLAAADYYWHDLNMVDFEYLPHYADQATVISHQVDNQTKEDSPKTTEPEETIAVSTADSISENELLGEWVVDAQYTMDYNSVSMRDIYGTSFSDSSNKMTFSSDGSFQYYVGWCYGNGTYELANGEINVTITDGDPLQGSVKLIIMTDSLIRIALDQYSDGNLVFWVKI